MSRHRAPHADPRRTAHPVLCLVVSCALLVGLFVFPGNAGENPYHVHIVIGGTAAERARALMLHVLRERAGIDGTAAGSGEASRARVLSIRANNDDGGAVFSAGMSGALLSAAIVRIPAPPQASQVMTAVPLEIPQAAAGMPDPPPRRA